MLLLGVHSKLHVQQCALPGAGCARLNERSRQIFQQFFFNVCGRHDLHYLFCCYRRLNHILLPLEGAQNEAKC